MQVEDRLSRAGTDIEDRAVSLLDVALAGYLGGGEVATADDFGVGRLGFLQSREMFLGNDEDVCGGLRVDVFESKDVIVFVNFFRGNFAAEDAAEQAVGGRVCHGIDGCKEPILRNDSTRCRMMSAGTGLRTESVGGFKRPYRTRSLFGRPTRQSKRLLRNSALTWAVG